MATDTCATKEQEAFGAASFHMNAEVQERIFDTTHDDRQRMPGEDRYSYFVSPFYLVMLLRLRADCSVTPNN
jgi:hypothetical protein